MNSKLPILLALPALAIPTIASAAQKQEEAKRRNVIFIITDDMRLDMTSYGGGKLQTPNIDMLRGESVDFTNACTTTGLSSPSRTALFTGRYGHRTNIEDNLHLWHCENITLAKEHSTIYEWAVEANYNVAYFGKWHLGHISPADRGVEHCVISAGESSIKKPKRPDFDAINRYYPDSQGNIEEFDEKPEYYTTLKTGYEKSEAKRQVDLGVEFIEQLDTNDERPIFLTVSFHTPHPSYKVPEPWNTMYDYRDVELPKSLHEGDRKGLEFQYDVLWPWMNLGHMSDDDWRKTISYSMGLCTMFDTALGELFDSLKEHGLWDDSLIIFTSDQGTMLAEHGLYDKGPYAYEGLMRIPMLVKMPNGEGAEVEHQVSLIDLNNTLVEYMGLEPNDTPLDSRSLMPLLEEGDSAWSEIPDEAFYRYEKYNGRWFGVRTIRTPEFKYSFNPNGDDQLYDLVNDPCEMNNLINDDQYSQTLKQLRIRLLEHLRESDDNHAYEIMSGYTDISLDKE
ncbi:MAG: sulfatase-like hydrolase/transferase [Rikenellaceae bacterium]